MVAYSLRVGFRRLNVRARKTSPVLEDLAVPSITLEKTVPMLAVSDMARAIAFYELLGFRAVRYQGGDGYAFLHRGASTVHLTQSDMLVAGRHPGHGIYFYLPKGAAAALEAEFRSAGVSIRSPLAVREWKMNEFVVVDPDENLLRFGEPA